MNTILLDGQLITPSKVICVGRNYAEHIAELGNEIADDMVIFIKPNSAITSTLNSFHHEQLHYEGEICFMYSQGKFSAVGFGLDLTKRTLQSKLKGKGLPWERAKAFDNSAVMSEFVSLKNIDDNLSLNLSIDGQITQQGGVELMIYKPSEILNIIEQSFTLEDGDIVMTGTPKGVGVINANSEFKANITKNDNVLVEAFWIAK